MALQNFTLYTYKTALKQCLPEKRVRNVSKFLKQLLNKAQNLIFLSTTSFKILSLAQILSACLLQDPVSLDAGLQIFRMLCTVTSDLQISRSAEDLSTAPSSSF